MSHNPLIYLFGYPGTGKTTIARAMEQKTDFIAIQNHLLSNAFRHVFSRQPVAAYPKIEPMLKHHTMKAWVNFLDFVATATPDQGMVFTSVLYQNDPDRVEFFEFIRKWASQHNRKFFPVRLVCSEEELFKRLQSPERRAEHKLTDPKILKSLLESYQLLQCDDCIELDITALDADQAAEQILSAIQS